MPVDRTVPGVCRVFNSPKSECIKDDCQELHICFYFSTGSCRFGDKCNRTHLLTTVHNNAVLKANGWQHDNQHPKILKLLEEKFKPKEDKPEEEKKTGGLNTPQVCFTYNTLGCGSDHCKSLHLCLNSVMNKCTLGSKCRLEHDLVKSDHNIRVLRSAKLLDTEQQVIADNLKEKYIAMSNQQNKQEPKKTEREPKQKEKSAQVSKGKEPISVKQDAEKDKPESRHTPVACIAYNKKGCNQASCPFLHVCFGYVMGSCDKKGKCLQEHNVFKGEQNKEVLRKFGLLSAKDVFAKIREGYEARAAAKAAAIESADGASGGATPPASAAQPRANPPASLTCSVCCEAFIRATTLACTHTFCEDCVRRAERQGQPCPLCRAPIATAVRSLVIDDTVVEWFDGQDEQTQLARRRLETERRRAAAVPQPLKAAPAADGRTSRPTGEATPASKKNKPPTDKRQQQQRSKSKGRGAKTVVTTTVTYH